MIVTKLNKQAPNILIFEVEPHYFNNTNVNRLDVLNCKQVDNMLQ